MASKREKIIVALHCSVCNSFNYTVKRSAKADKLAIKKFCRNCGIHTGHVQKKIAKPQ